MSPSGRDVRSARDDRPVAGAESVADDARDILRFPNGNTAVCVVEDADRDHDPRRLLVRLGLPQESARSTIVVCGGADDLVGEPLALAESVVGPAVTDAAEASAAAVVDGGTASGVMAVVGAAREHHAAAMPLLIGVAPRGRVGQQEDAGDIAQLEPHHSHFVLADSASWGGETGLLFRVAAAIAGEERAVVVLVGGGSVAREETLEAVRRNWPVIVVQGSGGFADELASASRRLQTLEKRPRRIPHRSSRSRALADASLRRIVRDGDLRLFSQRDSARLARWITWELSRDHVLKDAWRTFAGYDQRANVLRRSFERFQRTILLLGIVVTALALANAEWHEPSLRFAAIVLPSVLAVMIAFANRQAAGKRWVSLRAAAEGTKMEIYRYRTRTGKYGTDADELGDRCRSELLSTKLGAIDRRLANSEASSGPLAPDDSGLPPNLAGTRDDTMTLLDGDKYVAHRLADQLAYYRRRVTRADTRRSWLRFVSFAAGSGGTALAALGGEPLIALTTAVSAGAVSYLSVMQVDNLVVAYNQSAAELAAIRRDWMALDAAARDQNALESLVERTELALITEQSGWFEQMKAAVQDQQAQLAAQKAALDENGDLTAAPKTG